MTAIVELSKQDLQLLVPSVFAQKPWEGVSEKYKFIPSENVVDALIDNGFKPVWAKQGKTRIEGKKEYTKHMLRFRHEDMLNNTSKEIPEVVLVNAHDRTSSYKLMMGIFRMVCSNGLIVMSSQMDSVTVHHKGADKVIGDVITASFGIAEKAPDILEGIECFKTLKLTESQQKDFAYEANKLKQNQNISHLQLLDARRYEDKDNSLWTTFNVVQENMIRGGLAGGNANGRHIRTRQVANINQNLYINKNLWKLTEEFYENVA